jgi:hypothetical protein
MELAGYLIVLMIGGASAYFVYSVEKGTDWAKQIADGLAMQDYGHPLTPARRPSSVDRLELTDRIRTLRPRATVDDSHNSTASTVTTLSVTVLKDADELPVRKAG